MTTRQDDHADRGPVASLASSAATQPHWDGLARGELLIPRCESCGEFFFYPREVCPSCAGRDISFRQAAGTGTVVAASTARVALNAWPAEDVPYTAVLVRLEEGVIIPGRLAQVAEGPIVGAPVEVSFAANAESELPRWKLT